MSSVLLKKSLALCDPDLQKNKRKPKKPDEKQKARVTKLNKKESIKSNRKLTVAEARRALQEREVILEQNLKTLRKSKKACKLKLAEKLTARVIERASARKDYKIAKPKKEKKIEPTAFTEEDFRKFEAEYYPD